MHATRFFLLALIAICTGAAALPAAAIALVQDDAAATPDVVVTRALAALAELKDQCPPYIIRRLANDDDERVLAVLTAAQEDPARSWHHRALALVGLARHVRLHHASEVEVRDACLVAIEVWLGEGAEPMQRAAGLEAADELGALGEPILRRVTETAPDTLDRARALRLFAADRELPDYAWFKEILARGGKKSSADEKRDYAAGGALASLRDVAFEETADEMREGELIDALEDRSALVRTRAHRIQETRGDGKSYDRALALLDDDDEAIELRLWAAESLARQFDRERHYTILFEYGQSNKCDPELRNYIALQIRRAMPQRVLDLVRKQLGKGKAVMKLYAIDSLPLTVMVGLRERRPGEEAPDEEERAFDDEKVLDALRVGTTDKDAAVRVTSIDALVERKDFDALSALERAARKAKNEHDRAALLEARVALGAKEKDTIADAIAMLAAATGTERRAALSALVVLDPDAHEDALRAALLEGPPHEARAVVDAIVERRWGRGVGLLVAALDRKEIAVREAARAGLWQLTARDEGPLAIDWTAWWEGARGSFKPVEPDVADTFLDELGAPLRREQVVAEFLGIALEHNSVAVALDLGPEALAAPVQQRQHRGAIDTTLMSMVRGEVMELARQSGPDLALRLYSTTEADDGPWTGLATVDAEHLQQLTSWFESFAPVRTSKAEGLVGAALADPSIEALVLVSCGDPAKLDIEDLEAQRRAFVLQNRERGLVVHGVAVGKPSRLLRWLAKASGGTYTFVP